jgi:hypothetical protein
MKLPYTISISLPDRALLKLVEKNSTLPVEKNSILSTYEDNQTSILIKIAYGDNMFANDNAIIAEYTVDNIPPKTKATPKIEVHISINEELILNVKATIMDNGYTKTFEKIDLSKTVSANESNRISADTYANIVTNNVFEQWDKIFERGKEGPRSISLIPEPPTLESDDFTKFIFRIVTDVKFRQLFLRGKEQAFNNYKLDNEQIKALEIITPEILETVGQQTLLRLMTNIVNTIKNNPYTFLCSSCKGFGFIPKKKSFLGISSTTYPKCQRCNGFGFVK